MTLSKFKISMNLEIRQQQRCIQYFTVRTTTDVYSVFSPDHAVLNFCSPATRMRWLPPTHATTLPCLVYEWCFRTSKEVYEASQYRTHPTHCILGRSHHARIRVLVRSVNACLLWAGINLSILTDRAEISVVRTSKYRVVASYYSDPIGERSIVMSVSVCVCVYCLSAIISSKLHL